jgi:hypothetical protein
MRVGVSTCNFKEIANDKHVVSALLVVANAALLFAEWCAHICSAEITFGVRGILWRRMGCAAA